MTENGQTRALSEEERTKLLALAYRLETVSYPRIRKELQWGEGVRFADVRYGMDGTPDSYEKKYKLPALKGTHALRKLCRQIRQPFLCGMNWLPCWHCTGMRTPAARCWLTRD